MLPTNVPLAPFAGAVKVTVTPLTGLFPESFTVACSCVANAVFTVAFCGVPAVAVMLAGAAGITVNVMPLLDLPPTVTTALPEVAPAGTGTTMLVALQFVGVARVPLNVTVLDPCVAPKLVPLMVTGVPTGPDATLNPEI